MSYMRYMCPHIIPKPQYKDHNDPYRFILRKKREEPDLKSFTNETI